jgi:hypothetical protein
VLDQGQYKVQRIKDDDGAHDMLQLNLKFASLKEQSRFYGDIPDDNPVDCLDLEIGQGSLEEMADSIKELATSAEQAGMS